MYAREVSFMFNVFMKINVINVMLSFTQLMTEMHESNLTFGGFTFVYAISAFTCLLSFIYFKILF